MVESNNIKEGCKHLKDKIQYIKDNLSTSVLIGYPTIYGITFGIESMRGASPEEIYAALAGISTITIAAYLVQEIKNARRYGD